MSGPTVIDSQVATAAGSLSPTLSFFELHSLIAMYLGAIAAILAVLLGAYQLLRLRREAAVREALEFARQESSSGEWLKIRADYLAFIDKHEGPDGRLKESVVAANAQNMDDAVYAVLNRYEMLALAVRRKAIDEKFMWEVWRYALSRDWHYLSQIVQALRDQAERETLFCELEWLVKRWERPSFKPRDLL